MRPPALVLVALAALAFRLAPTPAPYLELDSALYLRAAAQYRQAFADGSWLTNPLTDAHYTAIEYWPPLFPLLAGLLGAWTLAAAAGWLTLFPVYLLARRLFEERAGLLAAGLVGLNPMLAWYARVPRSESLFLLLDASALALVLPPWGRAWAPILGGVCLGLAHACRFDAVLLLVATLAAGWSLRGRRVAALALLGFAVGAAPYLGYLAWLNGGVPTLISPKKALYDTLEGVWTRAQGRGMDEFTVHFGPPGMGRVDPADPEVRQLLQARVPGLVLEGLLRIPQSLASASWDWAPLLLVPVALGLRRWRDPRVRAMLWLLLPIPAYAVLTSWDPNPRYYAWSLLPLSVLAARGLEDLDGPAPGSRKLWALFALVTPLAFAASWLVPGRVHFDTRSPVEQCFLDLAPDPADLHLGVGLLGFGLAGLLARVPRLRPWAGLAGSAAALLLIGPALRSALTAGVGPYRLAIPASLALLALAPVPLFATLPRELWGPRMRRWLVAALAVLAAQNALWLGAWDVAIGRITGSPAMAEVLSRVARGQRVIAHQQVDSLRSGAVWVPVEGGDPLGTLTRRGADFLVLAVPEGTTRDHSRVSEVERSGRVVLEAVCAPSGGDLPDCPREWRLYRVSSASIGSRKPRRSGSGSRTTPKRSRTPRRISAARARISAAVAPPRFTRASTWLAERPARPRR